MIKLFVLDIDGCISHPFQTPDWETVSEIRELNRQSRQTGEIPALTLCTGRPLPYAEAVAQWLDIRLPFVFESAILFEPENYRFSTPYDTPGQRTGGLPDGVPASGQDGEEPSGKEGETQKSGNAMERDKIGKRNDPTEQIRLFRAWLTEELLPSYPGVMPEFSKMLDAGVVSTDRERLETIYRRIIEQTREHYPELEVNRTEVSVNTMPAGSNKAAGFDLISRELNIPLSRMAYIGDSEADLGPLKRVKMPFAPSNAIEAVRLQAEAIPLETSHAVLEAYRRIIERNRNGGVKP